MESFKHDDENNRNEDKYTDKDGTELENKAELVWEGQVRTGDEMKMNLAPWNGLGFDK